MENTWINDRFFVLLNFFLGGILKWKKPDLQFFWISFSNKESRILINVLFFDVAVSLCSSFVRCGQLYGVQWFCSMVSGFFRCQEFSGRRTFWRFFFSKLSPWKTLQFHRIVRGIAWSGYDGIFHPQPFVMENRWRNGRFLICLIFPGVELENAWLAILLNFFHCTGISNLEKCTIFDVVVSLCSSLTRGGQFNGIQFFFFIVSSFYWRQELPGRRTFWRFF